MSERTRSAWMYVALGCGGCALLIGVGAVVMVLGGIRLARGIERDMRDPAARQQKAERLLGADQLPAGYHAVFSVSVPLVFEMVLLADRPADPEQGVADGTDKIFAYVDLIRGDRRWQDFAERGGDPSDVLAGQGIRMERGAEEIDRGQLPIAGGTIDWVGRRGVLTVNDHRFDGLTTFLFVLCDGSKRMRAAVWANPDPHADTAVADADYRGTCVDPDSITAFVAPFDLCGG